jgi:hypothetical protein
MIGAGPERIDLCYPLRRLGRSHGRPHSPCSPSFSCGEARHIGLSKLDTVQIRQAGELVDLAAVHKYTAPILNGACAILLRESSPEALEERRTVWR